MNFNHVRTDIVRCVDLFFYGVDKEADKDVLVMHPANCFLDPRAVSRNIESPFGG